LVHAQSSLNVQPHLKHDSATPRSSSRKMFDLFLFLLFYVATFP
jgi:hypothetical protein